MQEELTPRIAALEAQFEQTVGQLAKLVGFMGNLSTALTQLTTTWVDETTTLKREFNGHSEGIEQLLKAQTHIASAVEGLSRQCAAIFKLQNERIATLEAVNQAAEQRVN